MKTKRIVSSVAKDASGTQVGQSIYSYDEDSRLVGIETPGQSKWQFVYDGISRLRVSRSFAWQGGAWVHELRILASLRSYTIPTSTTPTTTSSLITSTHKK